MRAACLGSALLALLVVLLGPSQRAHAGCNQIAAAVQELPSRDPSGATSVVAYVDRPVASPGDFVTVRADLACRPGGPGFALPEDPGANRVTLVFRPPGGGSTEVAVPSSEVTPVQCGHLRCKALRFVVPDTSGLVAGGLTGPAEIRVERTVEGTPTLVARVFELYQPVRACEPSAWERDPVFGAFTVLPAPNVLQPGSNPALAGAVDGTGALLVPFEFEAVLLAEAGAPVATLLRVVPDDSALRTALEGASSEDLRSFNAFGRPIPPLLRLAKPTSAVPTIVGTTDVRRSVLRVRPLAGVDYAALMASDVGPVQLAGAAVGVQSAAPLAALRASTGTVAGGVEEARVGDRNADGDAADLVAELTDVATGVSENTGIALAEVANAPGGGTSTRAAIDTQGRSAALLQSEPRDGAIDVNGDGDAADRLLRLFAFDAGTETYLEHTAPPFASADALPFVNGRPLALSGGRLFARVREGDAATRTTERVSVDSGGGEGDDESAFTHPSFPFFVLVGLPGLSADGRRVGFPSFASNLVAGDTNGTNDIFVHDRESGTTERVSVSSGEVEADGFSLAPVVFGGDGELVAFTSTASNLVGGDTNGVADIFVRDRIGGTTERVSVHSDGSQGDGNSGRAAMSADGRFVAFESLATNLVDDDANGLADVFVHDRMSGTTERVSVATSGGEGNGHSGRPAISADGRFVAFGSFANNLVPGDTNGFGDFFLHDRATGETELVTLAFDGAQGNQGTPIDEVGDGLIAISGEGRFVAFVETDTNLVPGDTNGAADIFLRDRSAGTTTRVSVASEGSEGNGDSFYPFLSADARYVAFASLAGNLVPGDTNGVADVFLHDRIAGTTERVSVGSAGGEASGHSSLPGLSADGRAVAFGSDASDLVAGDTNLARDVFVRAVDELSGDRNGDGDAEDTVLTVLDAGTGVLLNGAERVPTRRTAVAGGRALLATPEREAGDLNEDGDAEDLIAQLWSPPGDAGLLSSLFAVADGPGALALSAEVSCGAASEAGQGDEDLNFDGDVDDLVLGWARIDQGAGVAAASFVISSRTTRFVRAAGPRCAFLRAEADEPASAPECSPLTPSRCDLNGDGDSDDAVLHVLELAFDPSTGATTPTITNLGWAAEDFILSSDGSFLAFRTPEADEQREDGVPPGCLDTASAPGACDLNGDGDSEDAVLQVVELAEATTGPGDRAAFTTNTERAAIPCEFPACDAFDLYRMESFGPGEARASFLGTEPDQAVGKGCLPQSPPGGCDLDGDGLGTGVVVHLARLRQGAVTALQTLPAKEEATVPPFPETRIDETVQTVQQTECEAARFACPELQDPGLVLGATFPYEPGSCPSRFDLDPDGAPTNPNDLPGELDCVTLRNSIAGDSDRASDGSAAPDGVLDVAPNGTSDLCREAPDPEQTDSDGDGAGDLVCDSDPESKPPAELSCDLDGDGLVTKTDVDLVVEAIGERAVNFPPAGWDRRDRLADGRITSFDSALCSLECDFEACAESDPNASSTGTTSGTSGSCGLLGAEALLPIALALGLRRRRRAGS